MNSTTEIMRLSEKELLDISRKSVSLHERMYGEEYSITPYNEKKTEELLNKWREASAFGDEKSFRERLGWDDLTPESAKKLLGSVQLEEPAEWTKILNPILEIAGNISGDILSGNHTPGTAYIKKVSPIPFEELFIPFIAYARSKLSGDINDTFTQEALPALERYLLSRLSGAGIQTLKLEFDVFMAGKRSPLEKLLSGDDTSAGLYKDFITAFYDGRYLPFLTEYAFLTVTLAKITTSWIETINELGARLKKDLPEIQTSFCGGEYPGKVKKISTGLSDSHNEGRTVSILEFETGIKIVYKPKNLSIDKKYYEFLQWMNSTGELEQMKVVINIDRHTYGWTEYIGHEPCKNEEDIKKYYIRTGQLIFLVYALQGTDCHNENIIACGDQPVLIDLETMLSPDMGLGADDDDAKPNAALTASKLMMSSVLRTGFLPNWRVGTDGVKIDISALSISSGQKALGRTEKWVNINTDNMHLSFERVMLEAKKNIPFINENKPEDSGNHLEEIIEGFSNTYRFFLEHRKEFLAPGGMADSFKNLKVRYVPKQTKMYMDTLRKTRNPKYLRDGIDFGIGIEMICKANLMDFYKPSTSDMLSSELLQLSNHDVPFFTVNTNKKEFYGMGRTIKEKDFIVKSACDKLKDELKALSEEDLSLQAGYIKGSFFARKSAGTQPQKEIQGGASGESLSLKTPELSGIQPITSEECLAAAEEIAGRLEEQAIKSPDGSLTWIALELMYEANALQLKPIGLTFHTGVSGIGVFFACLYKITGKDKYRELCKAALKSIKEEFAYANEAILKSFGTGAGVGVGSFIYGLAASGELIGDESLIDEAEAIADAITPGVIESDKQLDIIFGAAGCILALLKLYSLRQRDAVLEKAILSGEHILNNMMETPNGERACPTMDGEFHTGFSHGAAGLSYALLRLFDITKDEKFREAALEEINYEESLFNAEINNYPDLRKPGEESKKSMTAWCHGAPGIGLGRLETYGILGDDRYRKQAERTVKNTLDFPMDELDQLCCGNAGRMVILSRISEKLNDEALGKEAGKKANYVIERNKMNGGYLIYDPTPSEMFSPGLFTGETGIAYALLYMAFPDKIPCLSLYK